MEKLTYNQIKKKVGEAWALIANPIISKKTGKLLRGELIFYHKNKEKVNKHARTDEHEYITVRYFGEMPTDQIYLLNIR